LAATTRGSVRGGKKYLLIFLLILFIAPAIFIFYFIFYTANKVPPPGHGILNAPRGELLQPNITINLKPGERKTIYYLLITKGQRMNGSWFGIVRYIPKNSPEWYPPPEVYNVTSENAFPLPEGLKVYVSASQRPYEKRVVPIVIEATPKVKPGCYTLQILFPFTPSNKSRFRVCVET